MRSMPWLAVLLACGCGDDGGSAPSTHDGATISHDGGAAGDGAGGDGGGSGDGGAGGDGGGTADAPPIDAPIVGEPPELAGITNAHNVVRGMVDTATPLPALTWSETLEATAAAYGAMCINADGNSIMDHNPNRSQGHPYYVGENIYASSGTATAAGAVNAWAAEKANYVYPAGYSPGTGHYTQIVWRVTRELGCARVSCANIQYGSTIICNYGPGGNSGGAPY